MTPRQVLEIIVRAIGVLLIVTWAFALTAALVSRSGLMIFNAFLLLSIGMYLLRGAPALLDWGFREPHRTAPKSGAV